MIQLKNINLRLGTRQIFDDISFLLSSNQRIGVVGRNGAGKSTLLKLIAGELKYDGGSIAIEKDANIAYMSQELTLNSDKSIFDEVFSVFDEFNSIEDRAKVIEVELENGNGDLNLLEEYSLLQEKIGLFDKSQALYKAESILTGLGFAKDSFDKPVSTLSVGWKMRIVLAQLLLKDADFYLFDEPTNHLDLVAQDWFFDFLKSSKFGFLLVSHDRYFLDKACTNILEIEKENARLYNGNFTTYIEQRKREKEILEATARRQHKEIEQKQKTIARFRASASKAKMAQSLIKQLDKIDVIEVEREQASIRLKFPEIKRAGSQVLAVKSLKQAFKDKTVFKDVSFSVARNEKVALVAANGKGKSTLFNTLVGKYTPVEGYIEFGHNVDYAYFEQYQHESLDPNNTIFDEVRNSGINATDQVIRSFLGNFLFSGDDIKKKISVLSGGERNRVALVKLLLQNANFLLLDEPTNHLDLYSKEALAEAIKQYEGTVLLVSHDHNFLDLVSTRILELESDKICDYPGTYTEYKEHKKFIKDSANIGNANNATNGKDLKQKIDPKNAINQAKNKTNQEKQELKKEARSLENKIKKLEGSIDQINKKFFEIAFGTPEYDNLADKLKLHEKELEDATEKWEKLFESLES